MSLKLPCDKCEHLCSYDAALCPNCGSNNPFGYPSRMSLCLAGLGGFFLVYLLGEIKPFASISGFVVILSLFCFLLAIFKTEIILFVAKVKYYRDGGQ